jgi:hypothetical protein
LPFHAFSNFISNAVKYSPLGSPIEVVVRKEPDWLAVEVRDCGIGIPTRDREHLFERYFRGSNATGVACPQREGVSMRMRNGTLLVFLITVLVCGPLLAQAKRLTAPTDTRLDEIVVTAKRRFDLVADAKMKEEVEEALHSDPFFYDAHVTVTTKNGVVTLEGIVFDDWDLRQAMRISK